MAVENKLLTLAFGTLIVLGFKVWFQNGCGPSQCYPSVFEVVTKFPRRKSGSIFPNFRGGNPVALRLRCVIAHQMLFSPSFRGENMAMGIPYFHSENPAEFHVWCVMVNRQGFTSMYTVCIAHTVMTRSPSMQQVC